MSAAPVLVAVSIVVVGSARVDVGVWSPGVLASVIVVRSTCDDAVWCTACSDGSCCPNGVVSSVGHGRSVAVGVMRSAVGCLVLDVVHDIATYVIPSGPGALTATVYVFTTPLVASGWLSLHCLVSRALSGASYVGTVSWAVGGSVGA